MRKKLNWLHLSDFHVGKNDYESNKLFAKILKFVREETNDNPIDLIFITGDITNRGAEKEFEIFYYELLAPLLEYLKIDEHNIKDKVFIVPGNHDLERMFVEDVDRDSKLIASSDFFNISSKGKEKRAIHEVRAFDNFCNFIDLLYGERNNWIKSEEASFHRIIKKDNITIGVAGINTAWLARGENDEKSLSPGIDIVENVIDKIANCNIKIVLGHHPLLWLNDYHKETISSIFSEQGIMYLHGHLHKNRVQPLNREKGGFLEVQSGAGYQIPEHEESTRKNGFVLGILTLNTRIILLQPRYWKSKERVWGISDDLFEDSKLLSREYLEDWWRFELPSGSRNNKKNLIIEEEKDDVFLGFDGWNLVNDEFYASREHLDENELLLSFFDGAIPIFHKDFLTQLPFRNATKTIIETVKSYQDTNQSSLTLVTGAGGEGKTTSLYQIILSFYNFNNWIVLWHTNSCDFTKEMFNSLPKDKPILLVSDDSEKIVKNMYEIVQLIKYSDINIHIVLGSRQTDWYQEKGQDCDWQKYINYRNVVLSKLELNESKSIVKLWSKFGLQGLKKLDGLSIDDAAYKLMKATEDVSSSSDGAFLGGMLKVRLADGLKEHIRLILSRLDRIKIDKTEYSLLDAYAAISFMHMDKINYLSFPVLSQYLYGKADVNLRNTVITPLGREAAATPSGDFIFTRHSSIASVSRELLSLEFNIEPNELYTKLGLSALSARIGVTIPKYRFWNYEYPLYFLDNKETYIGVNIAKSLYEQEPNDIHLLSNLIKIYTITKDYDLSSELFHGLDSLELFDRTLFTQWGSTERYLEHKPFATWLYATAISDFVDDAVTNANVKIAIKSLYFCFKDLQNLYSNVLFFEIQNFLLNILNIFSDNYKDNVKKIARNFIEKNYSAKEYINKLNEVMKEVSTYLDLKSETYKNIPIGIDLSYEKLEILLSNRIQYNQRI